MKKEGSRCFVHSLGNHLVRGPLGNSIWGSHDGDLGGVSGRNQNNNFLSLSFKDFSHLANIKNTGNNHSKGQGIAQQEKHQQGNENSKEKKDRVLVCQNQDIMGLRVLQTSQTCPRIGNGRNTVSRVLFRRRELTEPH